METLLLKCKTDNLDIQMTMLENEVMEECEGQLNDEVEGLRNSLREIVNDQDVRPKLHCLMMDPSFSMVTVQSEDSRILWETGYSHCSTPWTSEAYPVASEPCYSPAECARTSGYGTAGKIIFIMDENNLIRQKKKRTKTSEKKPLQVTDELLAETDRPAMVEVSQPNMTAEGEGGEGETVDAKEEKKQHLFSLVSEGSEILNIVVPPKLSTVDEEASSGLIDNLSYLEERPVVKADKTAEESKATDINLYLRPTDQSGTGRATQRPIIRTAKTRATADVDYLEKFTLIDNQSTGGLISETGTERLETVAEDESPASKTETISADTMPVSNEPTDCGPMSGPDIACELVDVVFYGAKETGSEVKLDDEHKSETDLPKFPLKKSGSALFGSQESILTPIFLPSGPPKIIDQILLDEPTAMAFMYSDLYAEAMGCRKRQDDTESMTSEKSFHSKESDPEDRAYLEKFVLKDETPVLEVEPTIDFQKEQDLKMWSHDTFGLHSQSDNVATQESEPEPEEITNFLRDSANSSPCEALEISHEEPEVTPEDLRSHFVVFDGEAANDITMAQQTEQTVSEAMSEQTEQIVSEASSIDTSNLTESTNTTDRMPPEEEKDKPDDLRSHCEVFDGDVEKDETVSQQTEQIVSEASSIDASNLTESASTTDRMLTEEEKDKPEDLRSHGVVFDGEVANDKTMSQQTEQIVSETTSVDTSNLTESTKTTERMLTEEEKDKPEDLRSQCVVFDGEVASDKTMSQQTEQIVSEAPSIDAGNLTESTNTTDIITEQEKDKPEDLRSRCVVFDGEVANDKTMSVQTEQIVSEASSIDTSNLTESTNTTDRMLTEEGKDKPEDLRSQCVVFDGEVASDKTMSQQTEQIVSETTSVDTSNLTESTKTTERMLTEEEKDKPEDLRSQCVVFDDEVANDKTVSQETEQIVSEASPIDASNLTESTNTTDIITEQEKDKPEDLRNQCVVFDGEVANDKTESQQTEQIVSEASSIDTSNLTESTNTTDRMLTEGEKDKPKDLRSHCVVFDGEVASDKTMSQQTEQIVSEVSPIDASNLTESTNTTDIITEQEKDKPEDLRSHGVVFDGEVANDKTMSQQTEQIVSETTSVDTSNLTESTKTTERMLTEEEKDKPKDLRSQCVVFDGEVASDKTMSQQTEQIVSEASSIDASNLTESTNTTDIITEQEKDKPEDLRSQCVVFDGEVANDKTMSEQTEQIVSEASSIDTSNLTESTNTTERMLTEEEKDKPEDLRSHCVVFDGEAANDKTMSQQTEQIVSEASSIDASNLTESTNTIDRITEQEKDKPEDLRSQCVVFDGVVANDKTVSEQTEQIVSEASSIDTTNLTDSTNTTDIITEQEKDKPEEVANDKTVSQQTEQIVSEASSIDTSNLTENTNTTDRMLTEEEKDKPEDLRSHCVVFDGEVASDKTMSQQTEQIVSEATSIDTSNLTENTNTTDRMLTEEEKDKPEDLRSHCVVFDGEVASDKTMSQQTEQIVSEATSIDTSNLTESTNTTERMLTEEEKDKPKDLRSQCVVFDGEVANDKTVSQETEQIVSEASPIDASNLIESTNTTDIITEQEKDKPEDLRSQCVVFDGEVANDKTESQQTEQIESEASSIDTSNLTESTSTTDRMLTEGGKDKPEDLRSRCVVFDGEVASDKTMSQQTEQIVSEASPIDASNLTESTNTTDIITEQEKDRPEDLRSQCVVFDGEVANDKTESQQTEQIVSEASSIDASNLTESTKTTERMLTEEEKDKPEDLRSQCVVFDGEVANDKTVSQQTEQIVSEASSIDASNLAESTNTTDIITEQEKDKPEDLRSQCVVFDGEVANDKTMSEQTEQMVSEASSIDTSNLTESTNTTDRMLTEGEKDKPEDFRSQCVVFDGEVASDKTVSQQTEQIVSEASPIDASNLTENTNTTDRMPTEEEESKNCPEERVEQIVSEMLSISEESSSSAVAVQADTQVDEKKHHAKVESKREKGNIHKAPIHIQISRTAKPIIPRHRPFLDLSPLIPVETLQEGKKDKEEEGKNRDEEVSKVPESQLLAEAILTDLDVTEEFTEGEEATAEALDYELITKQEVSECPVPETDQVEDRAAEVGEESSDNGGFDIIELPSEHETPSEDNIEADYEIVNVE